MGINTGKTHSRSIRNEPRREKNCLQEYSYKSANIIGLDSYSKQIMFAIWTPFGFVSVLGTTALLKLKIEPHREKTGFLHMRKQRRRSASR